MWNRQFKFKPFKLGDQNYYSSSCGEQRMPVPNFRANIYTSWQYLVERFLSGPKGWTDWPTDIDIPKAKLLPCFKISQFSVDRNIPCCCFWNTFRFYCLLICVRRKYFPVPELHRYAEIWNEWPGFKPKEILVWYVADPLRQTHWPVYCLHSRPGVDISGMPFLYQVMLGLG